MAFLGFTLHWYLGGAFSEEVFFGLAGLGISLSGKEEHRAYCEVYTFFLQYFIFGYVCATEAYIVRKPFAEWISFGPLLYSFPSCLWQFVTKL